MKKLILIMLAILTAAAFAYRLPTAWSVGGGLSFDSVRVTAYRGEVGSATLTKEIDTSFVGAGTDGSFALFVDSMVQYTVRYMYFCYPDTFREFTYGNMPIDYEKYVRAFSDSLKGAVADANKGNFGRWTTAQRDSLLGAITDANKSNFGRWTVGQRDSILTAIRDANKVNFGRWTAAQRDSILNAIADANKSNFGGGSVVISQADIDSIVAGVIAGTSASNGTGIYALTIYALDTINNHLVQGINLTAVAGATTYYATTNNSGYATFNVDSATWTINALGSPYTWVPITRGVAANTTDTINGGGVLVAAADSPSEATVYGTVSCPSCYVRFQLMAEGMVTDTSTGYIISRKVYNLKTNSIGYFSKSLPKTENLVYQSGTKILQPKWKITISPTDVVLEPQVEQTFFIDSDSTSLDIGGLIR